MIKRTIAITTPCHLSLKLGQMLVRSKLFEGDTGKQFGTMEIDLNTKQVDEIDTPQQLELF